MVNAKQISSLEKVFKKRLDEYTEISVIKMLRGERASYQIAASGDFSIGKLRYSGSAAKYAQVYIVDPAVLDMPVDFYNPHDDNYLTLEPALMPDILVPAKDRDNIFCPAEFPRALWIDIEMPRDAAPGSYTFTVCANDDHYCGGEEIFSCEMKIEVLDAEPLPTELIYTRWFHGDCIAEYHGIEVYSERHWELIDKHVRAAVHDGMNMILTPIHTPPLDTAPGSYRTPVHLVDIERRDGRYIFDFKKFDRFVKISEAAGIKYFEMAHLFSQGGAHTAANILITENGEKKYAFDHSTPSDSKEYADFLAEYLPAIVARTEELGIAERCFYHVSDEPRPKDIEVYRNAREAVVKHLKGAKTFDALTDYSYYEAGLVEYPVASVDHIGSFLPHEVPTQFIYYSCAQQNGHINSFLSMPPARVRMLGPLLYKYKIKGFLQWGLNFYNSCMSLERINPYTTTSADMRYQSGDPFILYPTKNGVYTSIRGRLTHDAISDLDLLRTAEKKIGRDAVVELVDKLAGAPLTFECYPKNKEFFFALREELLNIVK